jgi:hypothetical protein
MITAHFRTAMSSFVTFSVRSIKGCAGLSFDPHILKLTPLVELIYSWSAQVKRAHAQEGGHRSSIHCMSIHNNSAPNTKKSNTRTFTTHASTGHGLTGVPARQAGGARYAQQHKLSTGHTSVRSTSKTDESGEEMRKFATSSRLTAWVCAWPPVVRVLPGCLCLR